MKAKYILVSLLLVALVMGGTGYSVSAGSGVKATGGGTFEHDAWATSYASPGDKISFGFSAQDQGNGAKGQFHLINHASGMKVSGTISECEAFGGTVRFNGPCSIDGEESYFWAEVVDGGEGNWGFDLVRINFDDNSPPWDIYGQMEKGNIQKHK